MLRWLIPLLFLLCLSTTQAMEVAITVDDLPMNGNLPPQTSRLAIAKQMLAVFRKHHIERVYGFLNGGEINVENNGIAVLKCWVAEKQLLGNHTYDHLDLATTNTSTYINNIVKNEPILQSMMKQKNYHYFRYPYLAEGNTEENRNLIRNYLYKNNYKIAQVTVDFFEYEWNDPYVRCLSANDEESMRWIREAYVEQSLNALTIAHELSMMLFNRDIKNILLIHINYLTSEMLDELLTAYENHGVTFITLQEALTDPAYRINSMIIADRSYTFLNQVRLSRGLKNPDIVTKLYNSLPEDKLNSICR